MINYFISPKYFDMFCMQFFFFIYASFLPFFLLALPFMWLLLPLCIQPKPHSLFVCMPWCTRPVFIVTVNGVSYSFFFSSFLSAYSIENTQSVSHMAANGHMNTHGEKGKKKVARTIGIIHCWKGVNMWNPLHMIVWSNAMLGKPEKRAPWERKQVWKRNVD